MKGALEITLFGQFGLKYKGQSLNATFGHRLQELLAYLILNYQTAQSRQHLAFLFWPESSEKQAYSNLRQHLFHLRNTLPDADLYLRVDAKNIQWNKEAPFWCDVVEFENNLEEAKKAEEREELSLQKSLLLNTEELYKGKLLISCYEEWISPERERFHQAYLQTLEKIIHLFTEKRDYSEALKYAKKLLRNDPLRESSYREIMNLYVLLGDKGKAIEYYRQCKEVLERELGTGPSRETSLVFERISSINPTRDPAAPAEKLPFPEENWPLVGRDKEWKNLVTSWSEVLKGNPKAIFLKGDPGIGKTRLAKELYHYIKRQGYPTAYTKSYEAAGTLSYGAVTNWLRQRAIYQQIKDLDPLWKKDLARLLPELLIENQNIASPRPIKESWQKRQFLEAITRAILGNKKPLLLLLDDSQWADRESLLWLEHLFHFDPSAQILLLGTVRPVEGGVNSALKKLTTDLKRENFLTEVPLAPLNEYQTSKLASLIAKNKVDKNTAAILYQETEGNPLFIIESMREGKLINGNKTVFQHAYGASTNEVPSKIKEVILARLESLPETARNLMELAATIGREFRFNVLKEACGKDEDKVVDCLEELLRQQIIREFETDTYDFTHDKIREVAYMEMSSAKKKLFHKKIAGAIEKLYAEDLDQYYSYLAFHYNLAGNPEKAIHYYRESARIARDLISYNEAVLYLRCALELLEKLPDGQNKTRLERDLHAALSLSLLPLIGYSGIEVMESCKRILDLCDALGEVPQAPVKRFLAIGNISLGHFEKAYELGNQLYAHACEKADNVELVEANYILGSAMNWQGNFEKAKTYFTEGVEKYDPKLEQKHIERYGQNPMLICKVRLAEVLWILGDREKAEHLEREVWEEAFATNHPFSLAYIITWCCWLQILKENFKQAVRIGEKYFQEPIYGEFPVWLAHIKAFYGSALYKIGRIPKGIQFMRESTEISEKIKVGVFSSFFYCLLAEALAEEGKLNTAYSLINKAFHIINRTGERWLESEMYRIKGGIYLCETPPNLLQGRACYEKAIEVAQRQGAKSLVEKASKALQLIE